MGLIAWIILGLCTGMIAQRVVNGGSRDGAFISTLIGIFGALIGGYIAQHLFHVAGIKGFFNVSTWLTAIGGAAVLLICYHVLTGRRLGSAERRGVRR